MIKYRLCCRDGHEFDAWFRNSDEFDRLLDTSGLVCTWCGVAEVGKAVMAPRLARSSEPACQMAPRETSAGVCANGPDEIRRINRDLHAAVAQSAEYVGRRFAEEAREIHYAEAENRAIFGEATREEAQSLIDEGIPVLPLPPLPESGN